METLHSRIFYEIRKNPFLKYISFYSPTQLFSPAKTALALLNELFMIDTCTIDHERIWVSFKFLAD